MEVRNYKAVTHLKNPLYLNLVYSPKLKNIKRSMGWYENNCMKSRLKQMKNKSVMYNSYQPKSLLKVNSYYYYTGTPSTPESKSPLWTHLVTCVFPLPDYYFSSPFIVPFSLSPHRRLEDILSDTSEDLAAGETVLPTSRGSV